MIAHIAANVKHLPLKRGIILGMLSELFQSGYPVEQEGNDLYRINEETAGYGLALTHEEASELAATHRRVLESCGRVETGFDTVQNIIRALCPSRFLTDKNYADVLNEAVNAFYTIKNESEDLLSDRQVLSMLAKALEKYEGDLSIYLRSWELTDQIRALKDGTGEPQKEKRPTETGEAEEDDE